MYSMLPTKEQLKIFDAPPNGSRLIVLATNIAETSLTIPGIRYVFDSGRVKEKSTTMSLACKASRWAGLARRVQNNVKAVQGAPDQVTATDCIHQLYSNETSSNTPSPRY